MHPEGACPLAGRRACSAACRSTACTRERSDASARACSARKRPAYAAESAYCGLPLTYLHGRRLRRAHETLG